MTTPLPSPPAEPWGPIPARNANPFATCWTSPGRLPWAAGNGASVETLLGRLERSGRGQIVGPHGAGKSTLLEALGARLVERGLKVSRWTLNGSRRKSPRRLPAPAPGSVLFIDGGEQLGFFARRTLATRRRWRGIQLLVTTHRDLGLPTLAKLEPTLADALRLFKLLTRDRPTPVDRAAVAASYHRRNGNLREVWFDLYDRHERLVNRR